MAKYIAGAYRKVRDITQIRQINKLNQDQRQQYWHMRDDGYNHKSALSIAKRHY